MQLDVEGRRQPVEVVEGRVPLFKLKLTHRMTGYPCVVRQPLLRQPAFGPQGPQVPGKKRPSTHRGMVDISATCKSTSYMITITG